MKDFFSALLLFFLFPLLVSEPLFAENRQWREPVTGMEFVWIPAGSFSFGQTDSEKAGLIAVMGLERYNRYCADELPRHKVEVAGFWMGKYEVTNAQYLLFDYEHHSRSYKSFSLNGAKQPVVEVSWNDAVAYAKWLSSASGKQLRLPLEFEWEYACRAGTETMRYWGDDEKLTCLYANVADFTAKQEWPEWIVHDCDDGFAVTSPVGSFRPNDFQLYDMLGNVWEWCNNVYSGIGTEKLPVGDRHKLGCSLNCRVARGSCWDNPARYVRAASRNKRKPGYRGYNIGFRLVMIPGQEVRRVK